MTRSPRFAVAALSLLAAPAYARESAALRAHLDSARALARSDVSPALTTVLCGDPKELPAFLGPIVANSKPMAPTKAFDQLYYLGMDFVGAWALDTRDGIILFDALDNALDNAREAQDVIEGGLRTLGLDPARIRYVVVMHGHADHYGGAKYLQETLGPTVYMSAADWEFAPRWLAEWTQQTGPAGAAMFGPIPERDAVMDDGQRLTLGDTTITFHLTPGHTPGCLSAVIPVTDGGVPHRLAFWGGTALPEDTAAKQDYRRSVERFTQIVGEAQADGIVTAHPFVDGTLDRIAQLARRRPGDPHPFVTGPDAVRRYMDVHLSCVRAAGG